MTHEYSFEARLCRNQSLKYLVRGMSNIMDAKARVCAIRTEIVNSLAGFKKDKEEFWKGISLRKEADITEAYTTIRELDISIAALEGQLNALDRILLEVFSDSEMEKPLPDKSFYEVRVMYNGRYHSIEMAARSSVKTVVEIESIQDYITLCEGATAKNKFTECDEMVSEIYLDNDEYIRVRTARIFSSEKDGENHTCVKLVFAENINHSGYPIIEVYHKEGLDIVKTSLEWLKRGPSFF